MPDAPIHRVGIGTDIHRLVQGGPLKLGGIEIPFDKHLLGHSDADVVLHAVTDALLGAAALPDIGELFPDSDPEFQGRDSQFFLKSASVIIQGAGFRPAHIDLVIHAQRPKLSEYKPAIRATIARLLDMNMEQVSVKAKTNEELDSVGRGESIACTCVVGLTPTKPQI